MNIVHVTNSFKVNGTGITNVVTDLALAQSDAGHRVTVACAEADDAMRSLAESHGVTVVEGIRAKPLTIALTSSRALARLLNSLGSPIVHVHTVRAALLVALGSPWLFARRSVSTIHNEFQRSAVAMFLAHRVVAVSAADARSIRGRGPFRRATVIRNGTLGSPRLTPLAMVTPKKLDAPAIAFVGQISERKGVDVLLEAMAGIAATHPTATLYLVGNRDNEAMEQRARQLQLGDRVVFAGFSADPREYLLSASVFVLPSRAEPFGLVIVEARACGVPVVATSVGGIPEALSGGNAGLIVNPGDSTALRAAIMRVLEEPGLADELRTAGTEGLDEFTVERMHLEYERVYASI